MKFKKIKLSKNIKFWDLKHQFHLDLNQVSKPGNYKKFKQLSLTIIFLFLMQVTVLVLTPLNDFQRLLLSDSCFFLHLPQKINWIFICFSIENIVFHLKMYRPATRALTLVQMVNCSEDEQVNKFFVHPAVLSNGRVKLSRDIVLAYTQKYMLGISYFVIFESNFL